MVFRGLLILLDDVERFGFAVAREVLPKRRLLSGDVVGQSIDGIGMVVRSFRPSGRALDVDDFVVESRLRPVLR